MNLDSMTVGELKQIRALLGDCGSTSRRLPMPVGKGVFIRTVTHHFTGRVVAFTDEEVALSSCCWIADDGRFAQAMESGSFSEVEPYPKAAIVHINRASVIDWHECAIDLPGSQK